MQIGDSIKSLAACDRLPEGTIVAFEHPVYHMPAAAVRWKDAHGELFWEVTGDGRARTKTRTIKQAYGWAPFVIVWLPGEPLNTEVMTGYRTYGKAPS